MRGAECSTDHVLIRTKTRLRIRPVRRTTLVRAVDCNSLTNPNVKAQLHHSLAAELDAHPADDMERSWEIFKSAIHAASTNAIDYRKRKNQDWFDNNCTGIHKLLEEKKSAHDACLVCPQSAILKAIFQTLRNTVKIKLKQSNLTGGYKKRQKYKDLLIQTTPTNSMKK